MSHLNVEIKARCDHIDAVRSILKERKAEFKGIDYQVDTYFKCNKGRLKLREGNIEYNLIYYNREEIKGPKKSDVTLYHPKRDSNIKEILTGSLGILVVVKKKREIYSTGNVKFHIDEVEKLGSFIEIEAIDINGNIGYDRLLAQCNEYMQLFNIKPSGLISSSYSDMLLNIQ